MGLFDAYIYSILTIGLKVISPIYVSSFEELQIGFTIIPPALFYMGAGFYVFMQQYDMFLGFILGIIGGTILTVVLSLIPFLISLFVYSILSSK